MSRGIIKPQVGDLIDIDACLEETHDLGNMVTDHPVEEGMAITDHVRPEPDRVTLRCFVSNTPLSTEQVQSAVRAGDVQFRTTAPRDIENRGTNAFLELKKMRDQGTLISVTTSLKQYGVGSDDKMVIERLSIPRTLQNVDGLEFSLSLKQIRVVKTRSSAQTKTKDTRGNPRKKKGAKTTPPAEEKSALAKIDDLKEGGLFIGKD